MVEVMGDDKIDVEENDKEIKLSIKAHGNRKIV